MSLNEWVNCAGSYSIQGFAESFVEMISGSYSNVVGLPMHIIYKILKNNNFFNMSKKNSSQNLWLLNRKSDIYFSDAKKKAIEQDQHINY